MSCRRLFPFASRRYYYRRRRRFWRNVTPLPSCRIEAVNVVPRALLPLGIARYRLSSENVKVVPVLHARVIESISQGARGGGGAVIGRERRVVVVIGDIDLVERIYLVVRVSLRQHRRRGNDTLRKNRVSRSRQLATHLLRWEVFWDSQVVSLYCK